MQQDTPPAATWLSLALPREWALVSLARRFVADCVAERVATGGLADRVGMAAHELMENAVKYGLGPEMTLELEIAPAGRITLRVGSRIHSEQAEVVRGLLDAIDAADDPDTHYRQLLELHLDSRPRHGLGLARICAEGKMRLQHTMSGDRLTITAISEGNDHA